MVILVTGKAGAGKTTYALRLADELLEDGLNVRVIDGDEIRRIDKNDDFTDVGRYRHLIAMARSASRAEQLGYICIVSAICPKASWRREMRAMWQESMLVYIPGGTLWEGTSYERPRSDEF